MVLVGGVFIGYYLPSERGGIGEAEHIAYSATVAVTLAAPVAVALADPRALAVALAEDVAAAHVQVFVGGEGSKDGYGLCTAYAHL